MEAVSGNFGIQPGLLGSIIVLPTEELCRVLQAARTGHTVVQMASALVLFGGEDVKGKTLNDIYILQLEALLWLRAETKYD